MWRDTGPSTALAEYLPGDAGARAQFRRETLLRVRVGRQPREGVGTRDRLHEGFATRLVASEYVTHAESLEKLACDAAGWAGDDAESKAVRDLERVLHTKQPMDHARIDKRDFAQIDHSDGAPRPDMARLLIEQRHRRQIMLTMQRDQPRAAIIAASDRVFTSVRTRASERFGMNWSHDGTSAIESTPAAG
jgi:hypothetical protein